MKTTSLMEPNVSYFLHPSECIINLTIYTLDACFIVICGGLIPTEYIHIPSVALGIYIYSR